jgi:hypothetical protein
MQNDKSQVLFILLIICNFLLKFYKHGVSGFSSDTIVINNAKREMVNHRHKMISNTRYSIDIYERFYKVQGAAIFEYFKSKSRLKTP